MFCTHVLLKPIVCHDCTGQHDDTSLMAAPISKKCVISTICTWLDSAPCDFYCTPTLQLFVKGMTRQETSAACAKDANLSRKLAVVLSLPVSESASLGDGSRTASSFWPPKSFTDSGLLLAIMDSMCVYAVSQFAVPIDVIHRIVHACHNDTSPCLVAVHIKYCLWGTAYIILFRRPNQHAWIS